MDSQHPAAEALMESIRRLPPDKIVEVANFVDFLHSRLQHERLARATTVLSQEAFAKVWDNPEDSIYDDR